MKEHPKTVDTFLHFMFCAYLDCDFKSAKTYLQILRDINQNSPESFHHLDKFDKKRLIDISKAIDLNSYIYKIPEDPENSQQSSINIQNSTIPKENNLVKLIIKNQNNLARSLRLNMKLATAWQETTYGIVDLVAYTKIYAIPIEVKLNRANHQIVGQIMKYIKYFYYKVNYMLWRDVIGVTIAQDYTPDVLQELKKINVIPMVYFFTNDKLLFRKT